MSKKTVFSFSVKAGKSSREIYVHATNLRQAVNKLYKAHPKARVTSVWLERNAVPEIVK